MKHVAGWTGSRRSAGYCYCTNVTCGGLHSDACLLACGRLWLSVCSPPLLLFFHLSLFFVRLPPTPPPPTAMFWFPPPTPKSLLVFAPLPQPPHSATQWFGRETQGPSVSPLEPPRPPSVGVAPNFLTPHFTCHCHPLPHTHRCSQASERHCPPPPACRGGRRGVTMILHLRHRHLHPHACPVCVCAVHSPPTTLPHPPQKNSIIKKKNKKRA